MEQILIGLSLALIAGLLMSRLAKAVNLPAVTSYLVAGLLLGPFFLGKLGLSGLGFGFGTLEQVEGYGIITQVALGFIAFVIGNEFRLSALKTMGQQAITVGIAQAVITTALVDVALVVVHFLFPDVISMASAITLGAIAAATAPAATLMVVKQYKADGPLTHLLLMVVAIDDAVGLVLFSASYGVANALEQGHMDPVSVIVEPLVEIALSLLMGAVAGYVLNLLEVYFHSRSKRMSLSVAFVLLTVGLSMIKFEMGGVQCGFSLLLVCMMTGTVFCNVCPTSEELMDRLDRWVSPINILFFVLSGAELDLTILSNPLVLLIGGCTSCPAPLARSAVPMSAAAPPSAAPASRSIWASPCCLRQALRWVWQHRRHSCPMDTWCATWCCSRCWYTSWWVRCSPRCLSAPQERSSPRVVPVPVWRTSRKSRSLCSESELDRT